jgi:hypothetical protein
MKCSAATRNIRYLSFHTELHFLDMKVKYIVFSLYDDTLIITKTQKKITKLCTN